MNVVGGDTQVLQSMIQGSKSLTWISWATKAYIPHSEVIGRWGPKNPQPFKTESGEIGPWKSHHCHHFTLTESLEKSPLHYSRNSRGSECESGKSLFPPKTINVLWNTEWTSEAETTQASPLWAENREGKVGFRQQAPPFLQHTLWWVWQQALSGHHFTLSSEAA